MSANYICIAFDNAVALTLRTMVSRDPQSLQQNYAKLDALKSETRKELSAYEKTIRVPEDRTIFERFKIAESSYMLLQGKVVELSQQDRLEEARTLINGEMNQHADVLSKALNDLIEFNDRGANDAASRSVEVFNNARRGVIVALLIVALASLAVALGLIRSIVLPLRQSVILAETVATGNLTSQIDVTARLSRLQRRSMK